MKTRSDQRGDLLAIRAFYSVPALAKIANASNDVMRRLLRANGVRFLEAGRTLLVPISEIRQKIVPLWKSLVEAERLRRAKPCPKCGWVDSPDSVLKNRTQIRE